MQFWKRYMISRVERDGERGEEEEACPLYLCTTTINNATLLYAAHPHPAHYPAAKRRAIARLMMMRRSKVPAWHCWYRNEMAHEKAHLCLNWRRSMSHTVGKLSDKSDEPLIYMKPAATNRVPHKKANINHHINKRSRFGIATTTTTTSTSLYHHIIISWPHSSIFLSILSYCCTLQLQRNLVIPVVAECSIPGNINLPMQSFLF